MNQSLNCFDENFRVIAGSALHQMILRAEEEPGLLLDDQFADDLISATVTAFKSVLSRALLRETQNGGPLSWSRLFNVGGTARLYQSENLTINVNTDLGAAGHIYWTEANALYFVHGGSLKLEKWDVPLGTNNDQFYSGVKLQPVEGFPKVLSEGERFSADGSRSVFDCEFSDQLNPKNMLFSFQAAKAKHLNWIFNRSDLTAKAAAAGSLNDTMKQILLNASKALNLDLDRDVIIELTKDERHFVRWSAVQYLGVMSPALALQSLEEMTTDPHPIVRANAQKIFSRSVA